MTNLTSTVASQVELYRRRPTPLEHERLRPLVAEAFGPGAAEFFDREGRLPLRAGRGLPWPMERLWADTYNLLVLLGSIVAGVVALLSLRTIAHPFIASMAACVVVLLGLFGIPALMKRFPPSDIDERNRLVGVFDEISDELDERAIQARRDRLHLERESKEG